MRALSGVKRVLVASVFVCSLMNPITVSAQGGRQILFSIENGRRFTYLEIEGTNQHGHRVKWSKRFDPAAYFAITKDYWWKETVVLTFDIEGMGRHSCVIDYLKQVTGSAMTGVMYTPGAGCSGGAGNVSGIALAEAIIRYDPDVGYQIVEGASAVRHGYGCLRGILKGFETGIRGKVMTIKACGGFGLYLINKALAKYEAKVVAD